MDYEIRWMNTKDLQTDPVADELANSEAMQPYMNYVSAALKNDAHAVDGALALIKNLPVEKRYVWRVVSMLKWALADFDSSTVKLDLPHISEARRSEILQELQLRYYQLGMLVSVLKGN